MFLNRHLLFSGIPRHGLLEELTAPKEEILQFWKFQEFKKNPQLTHDPEFWDGLDFEKEVPIPLLLHGDSASYCETDSVMVVSIRHHNCWWVACQSRQLQIHGALFGKALQRA